MPTAKITKEKHRLEYQEGEDYASPVCVKLLLDGRFGKRTL